MIWKKLFHSYPEVIELVFTQSMEILEVSLLIVIKLNQNIFKAGLTGLRRIMLSSTSTLHFSRMKKVVVDTHYLVLIPRFVNFGKITFNNVVK